MSNPRRAHQRSRARSYSPRSHDQGESGRSAEQVPLFRDLDGEPWPGWPLPDHRPVRRGPPRPPQPRTFTQQRRDWVRPKVHAPQRIERPDLLRMHLCDQHGYSETGLIPPPETHAECYALHDQLHRAQPGGRLMGPSR